MSEHTNYKASLNLLRLPGAYLGQDAQGQDFVCIPLTEGNGTFLNQNRTAVYVDFFTYGTSLQYRAKCSESGRQPPTHKIILSVRQHVKERMIADETARLGGQFGDSQLISQQAIYNVNDTLELGCMRPLK